MIACAMVRLCFKPVDGDDAKGHARKAINRTICFTATWLLSNIGRIEILGLQISRDSAAPYSIFAMIGLPHTEC